MIRTKAFPVLIILFCVHMQCQKNGSAVQSLELGSSVDSDGLIEDYNLSYTFRDYQRKGTVRDLFNYLYFEGDTLCFSSLMETEHQDAKINAFFIDMKSGRSFPAERIDIIEKRISGFSLVGSIMESFFHENLNDEIPHDKYCCKEIPFSVLIEVSYGDTKIEAGRSSSFIIRYN